MSVHRNKWRSLMVRPMLCLIAGAICVSMATAWYPKWYGRVVSGGHGTEMSAEKYAETLDWMVQRGYGQLASYADQARRDAERENNQKLLCWVLAVVGGVFGLCGLGDAVIKTVLFRKQAQTVSEIEAGIDRQI